MREEKFGVEKLRCRKIKHNVFCNFLITCRRVALTMTARFLKATSKLSESYSEL